MKMALVDLFLIANGQTIIPIENGLLLPGFGGGIQNQDFGCFRHKKYL